MLHKLRNASHLSFRDWLFFIEAWFWLLVFDIGLRALPFPKLQTYTAQLATHPISSPEQTRKLLFSINNAVDHACYNHIYPMTCLRRSLVLQKMLSKRGIATELKIGVRKEAGQLSAHAWVEYQGKSLGEIERVNEQFSSEWETATFQK
jgi:hypothetical protein